MKQWLFINLNSSLTFLRWINSFYWHKLFPSLLVHLQVVVAMSFAVRFKIDDYFDVSLGEELSEDEDEVEDEAENAEEFMATEQKKLESEKQAILSNKTIIAEVLKLHNWRTHWSFCVDERMPVWTSAVAMACDDTV